MSNGAGRSRRDPQGLSQDPALSITSLRFFLYEFARARGGQNVPSWDGLQTSSALTELLLTAALPRSEGKS